MLGISLTIGKKHVTTHDIYCYLFVTPLKPTLIQLEAKDSSGVDVHICKSSICSACLLKPRVQFIKVLTIKSQTQNLKVAQAPFAAKNKLIIENMVTIMNNNQRKADQAELSEDEDGSVQKFIKSIEQGDRV